MVAYTKFNSFTQDLGRGVFNLNSDTLKVMFTNTAPVATNAVKADITEISAGNGYTAGGITLPTTSYSQTSGVGKLVSGSDPSISISGTVGPLRYGVLYDSTAASGNLIGWYDRGASSTLVSGDTLTVDTDQSAGILTVT